MKYFLDTEFLEGTQKTLFGKTKPTIDLISIGIVCEDGREYYAISKDFNLKEAWNRYDIKIEQVSGDMRNHYPSGIKHKVYWLRENVLKNIFPEKVGMNYIQFKRLVNHFGKSNEQIAKEIKHFVANRPIENNKEQWILDYDTKDVQFYGYYADYDWVVFCWLFGRMIDLPKGFPMYCIDLKQTLDEKEYIINNTDNYISPLEIKDSECDNNGNITKKYVLKSHVNYPKQTNEHNALSDAKWNFELYKFLNTI